MDANKVLRRYSDGERDFRLQDLKDLSLVRADLTTFNNIYRWLLISFRSPIKDWQNQNS